jgi:hypothetical protein
MNIPVLGRAIDERFLNHRLRSTSAGGMAGGALALSLFAYRYYHDHVWSSDLLAVGLTIVAVKLTVLLWYRLND